MARVAPNCQFMETSGESGGLVFNIPFDHVKELGNIFSLLDQKSMQKSNKELESLSKIVSDVSVSQTTLEEVFMAVSNYDD
jgi:hypothetical protein